MVEFVKSFHIVDVGRSVQQQRQRTIESERGTRSDLNAIWETFKHDKMSVLFCALAKASALSTTMMPGTED